MVWIRLLEWLASRKAWMSLLLATVLSVSMGYLVEVALIEGAQVLRGGNLLLLLLGVAAGLLLAVLWSSRTAAGAKRGCFVHAVTGPASHLARATAEHSLLTAWAAQAWPFSPVLPLRPALGADDLTTTRSLAETVVRQTHVATALVPTIKCVTILPGGPPQRMALLGAQLADQLGDTHIRLMADNTAEDCEAFVEFELPDTSRIESVTDKTIELFLEGKRDTSGGANDNAARIPAAPTERPTAYTNVLVDVRDKLMEESPSEVIIRSSAPASLTLGAGLVAARLGLKVSAQAFAGQGTYGPTTSLPPEQPAWPASRGNARAWWAVLILTSLVLGFGVPLLSGSIALTLEWGIAGSQSQGSDRPPCAALILVLAISAVITILSYCIRRKGIDSPTVSVGLAGTARQPWQHRYIQAPVVSDPAAQAQQISDAVSDAITVLPQVDRHKVALDPLSLESACAVVSDQDNPSRLDVTLRARRPVALRWNTQRTVAGPREHDWPTA